MRRPLHGRRGGGDNGASAKAVGVQGVSVEVGFYILDRLPPRLKAALDECPVQLVPDRLVWPSQVDEYVRAAAEVARAATVERYGPDHPQASGPPFKPLKARRKLRR